MTSWIDHDGGDCPVHPDTIVRFRFIGGDVSKWEHRARDFVWNRRGWQHDVAAYRVVQAVEEEQEAAA